MTYMPATIHSSRPRTTATSQQNVVHGSALPGNSTAMQRQSDPRTPASFTSQKSVVVLPLTAERASPFNQQGVQSIKEENSLKRSRDTQQQEGVNDLSKAPWVHRVSFSPGASDIEARNSNETLSKKSRSSKLQINKKANEKSKTLLSAMGTLTRPPPSSSNPFFQNSVNMEQVQARRRLSGGAIEAFLGDYHVQQNQIQRNDDMDTDSVNSGRPRSMSF